MTPFTFRGSSHMPICILFPEASFLQADMVIKFMAGRKMTNRMGPIGGMTLAIFSMRLRNMPQDKKVIG